MKFYVATIQNCSEVRFNVSALFPFFREGPFTFCAGRGRWAIKKNKCLKMKFSRKKNYSKVSMRNRESDAGKY